MMGRRGSTILFGALALWLAWSTGGSARAADPTTADCLAANDASITLRREHKLRAARAQLLICAALSCPAEIRRECTRRVDAVNTAIPTVVFEIVDSGGNDLTSVKVTVDGEALVDRLEGTALSIDPGPHTFTFESPGKVVVRREFVILEGQKDRRLRIELADAGARVATAPTAPAPSPAVPSAAAPPPAAPATAVAPLAPAPVAAPSAAQATLVESSPKGSDEPGPFQRLGTQRTVAVASAAVGLVGLGLGIAFGLDSMSKHDDAKKVCPGVCTTQHGVDLWNDAVSAGNVSTVGFVVAGLGLAGAAVLWFLPPSESSRGPSTALSVGPGTIGMKGTW
jgi:hypothetical protein